MLGTNRLLWTKDGKNGPDDPTTSMSILLKWLTTEGNYNKYRGGSGSLGKGKMYWCNILSQEIKQAGVRTIRTPKAIKNKISNIEDMFKEAHDWAHQTGAGVKEDDPRQFNDYVKKKCPYYFDLLEVMQDRATARPQFTSDDYGSDDDDVEFLGEVLPEASTLADDDSVSTRNTKSVASCPNSAKKQKTNRGGRDDPVISMMSFQVEAMAEAARHNKRMEELEEKKLESTCTEIEQRKRLTALKEKEMELSHRLSLVDAYEKVKGRLSHRMIRKRFPELIEFLESDTDETT